MEAATRSGERQAQLWGPHAQDWAETHEPLFRPLYDAVLDALEVGDGTYHLDVGCGAGLAAQMAFERGARIAGLDATPELLEIARSRVPDGDFRQADLEQLPFDHDVFDTIAGFNSFQFAGDPATALREAARVGKVGTPIAVATWGPHDQCQTATVFGALGTLAPPSAPGGPGPFELSDPGRLEAFVEQAGMLEESEQDVEVMFDFPDLDTAVRAMEATVPGALAIEHSGEERTRETVTEALEQYRTPAGGVSMHNVFRYSIAYSN